MCLLQINREEKGCLHCGHGAAAYCEKCYQRLVSLYMKKQAEKFRLERKLAVKENENHIPRLD